MLYILIPLLATVVSADMPDWRERTVPSFEKMHDFKEGSWEAPGAQSFRAVADALKKLQTDNNISEASVSGLPIPEVIDFNMTMSDGVGIWTRIVNPWPHNSKKPACLVRSPYGSYASQNLALIYLVLNGHAAVMQETRGTWNSGGVFDMWQLSGQDAKDTVAWITKQEWSNGEVYSVGASADGIDAIEETLANPKQLYGEWLIWTTANGHHFVYPGGAYRKDLLLGYFGSLNPVTHGTSSTLVIPETENFEAMGPWWYNLTDCRNASDPSAPPGCRYKNIHWPTIMSAGWWDLFSDTMLDAWVGLREQGNLTYRDDHVLIVGPLGHNIVADLDMGVLESTRLRAAEVDALVVGGLLASEFWRWRKCSDEWTLNNTCECQGRVKFGKGNVWSVPKVVRGSIKCDTQHFDDPLPHVAKECQCQEATGKLRQRIGRVNLFVMGSFGAEIPTGAGNYWTSIEDFPKPITTPLYVMGGAALSHRQSSKEGSSSYQYDPKNATPMIGGDNLPLIGSIKYGGSADQLPRESRPDVLVFDSLPLEDDLPIVGKATATVFVSSSAPDTDFFVTVSDLHPESKKSMLVRYGIQRMRWRDSEVVKSEPMSDGKIYEITISLGYTAYIFPKGHSIRMSISSSADPYYVATSNTGRNDMTTKGHTIVAQNSVYFAPDRPSRLNLPVVAITDIPENPHFTAVGPFVAARFDEIVV